MTTSSAAESSALSLLWNNVLFAASSASFGAWTALFLARSSSAALPKAAGATSFWQAVWEWRRSLSLLYVLACGIRATWPRQDGERVCMWDHPLSPPLIGRSLACCAELAFAALVCATLVRVIRSPAMPRIASIIFAANAAAQTFCNYSVITRDQRGHVLEESIWALSGVAVTFLCARQLLQYGYPQPNGRFLLLSALGGAVYVAFMVIVDVPMYIQRSLEDAAVGRKFAGFAEGIAEMSACRLISQSDSYWRVEMPWMSLYFTVAVWASLWLGFAEVPSTTDREKAAGRKSR
jgi:hypothetical protein